MPLLKVESDIAISVLQKSVFKNAVDSPSTIYQRTIQEENPNLLYYYEKRFRNDLESNNGAVYEHAKFFKEGLFLCYMILREQYLKETANLRPN